MIASSTSMDDEMIGYLIQFKEKIVQITKIISRLVTPSTQALVTPIAKLSSTSKDQDLS